VIAQAPPPTIDDLTVLRPDRARTARDRHWRLVRRRCGETTAARTWLAEVGLSVSQIALPDQPYLVARTPRGWRLMYAQRTG
jgi:hypothetical protein